MTAFTADLAASIGQRLPGRIVGVALAAAGGTDERVAELLATTGARSVVIRRERHLFPVGEILQTAARARDALDDVGSGRSFTPAPDGVAARPEPPGARRDGLNQPRWDEDDELGRAARAAWHERLADMYRTLQLARWAARPPAWEV